MMGEMSDQMSDEMKDDARGMHIGWPDKSMNLSRPLGASAIGAGISIQIVRRPYFCHIAKRRLQVFIA